MKAHTTPPRVDPRRTASWATASEDAGCERVEARFGGLSDTISQRVASSLGGGDRGIPSGLIPDIGRIATPFGRYATMR